MDKVPRLGELITGPQDRDAIHIAVAPVTAGETLRPGQRIGFTTDGDAFTVVGSTPTVGIVDPFLHEKAVYKGDRFYMFLLPNTITSLRHDWTHPAFEKEAELAKMEPTLNKLRYSGDEQWITEYAQRIGSTYDEIMEAAESYQTTGDYLVRGGTFEGEYIPDEFWDKYEAVKRTKVRARGSFLGCSC
jgi:hypothetical protein